MKNVWSPQLDPTYNEVTSGSVYPASGLSIAASATGAGKRLLSVSGSGSNAPAAQAAGAGVAFPAGNLGIGLVVFLVLTAIVMFVVHRWGEDGDFSNLRASAYNILVVSLIAAVGIPIWKITTWKLADMGVPLMDHAATWVLAA
jgi:hypothetical protein